MVEARHTSSAFASTAFRLCASGVASQRYHRVANTGPSWPGFTGHTRHVVQGVNKAIEQRDAADEGRLEPGGSIMVDTVIVNQSEVVRPSQLIASVGRTTSG
jgi:hypothetical protein